MRVWYMPSSCSTKAFRIRSRSRRVRSHSSNWPSPMRSSMIRVTIARIAGSSRDASERTDASTPSASMISAASRVCGLGPAWRKRRSSTPAAAFAPSAVAIPPYGSAARSFARA